MLLIESKNAQLLRSKMLNIFIDTINNSTGSVTKFIYRRDIICFLLALQESNYQKGFTTALSLYIKIKGQRNLP